MIKNILNLVKLLFNYKPLARIMLITSAFILILGQVAQFSVRAEDFTTSDLDAILSNTAYYDPFDDECTTDSTSDTATVANSQKKGPVYVIGDSIARDSKDLLTSKLRSKGFDNITVNGHGGRGINKPATDGQPGAAQAIQDDKSTIIKAKFIVIILGTNKDNYKNLLPTFIDSLNRINSSAKKYWVNVGVNAPNTEYSESMPVANKAIEDNAISGKYKIIDWKSEVDKNPNLLDMYGVHPNNESGYPLFTNKIISSIDNDAELSTSNNNSVAGANANDLSHGSNPKGEKASGDAIWKYFANKGLGEIQIVGIMANLYQESRFTTYDQPAGLGLAQWIGDRKTRLINYAKNKHNNESYENFYVQLDFMWFEELNAGFKKSTLEPLLKAKSYEDATKIWLFYYEICGSDHNSSLCQENVRIRTGFIPYIQKNFATNITQNNAESANTNGNCAPKTNNSCESLLLPTIVNKTKLANVINNYVKNAVKDSPFEDLGDNFVEGAISAGISPFIAVLHAHKESSFATAPEGWHNNTYATSAAAAARDSSQKAPSYNAYGRSAGSTQPTVWYPGGGGPRPVFQWKSWEDSLVGKDSFNVYYKRLWIDEKKFTTFDEIIKEYAPASDGNAPDVYTKFMKENLSKLINQSGDALDCGGGAVGSGGSGGSNLSSKDSVSLKYGYYLNSDNSPKMIYYSQGDNRYNGAEGKKVYPSYNNGTGLGPFERCGCFPTSMAMAINTVGPDKKINPLDIGKDVANDEVNNGGCGYSGRGDYPPKLSSKYKVKIKSIRSMDEASEGLRNGGLVVISMNQSVFTSSGHYIVLRGITASGEYAVADPISTDKSLSGKYSESYIYDHSNASDGRMWVISANK